MGLSLIGELEAQRRGTPRLLGWEKPFTLVGEGSAAGDIGGLDICGISGDICNVLFGGVVIFDVWGNY